VYFCVKTRDAAEHNEEYNKDILVAGYTSEILILCYDSFFKQNIRNIQFRL